MQSLIIDNYQITTPLIDIINRLQITLTNGKLKDVKIDHDNIVVTCPHHSNGLENKAACNIYIGDDPKIEYGFMHCFVCDERGSFSHFVAECFDSSEQYAKDWLKKNFGVLIGEQILIGDDISLTKKAVKHYNDSSMKNYQDWTPYLAKRNLDRTICAKFNVKYDNQHRQVIFPVYDANGNLLMLPKRNIDNKIFYLDAGVEKPIYGLNVITKNNIRSCMVVEGPIDMLSCWSNGVPAIATLGAPADKQIEQINKSCISTLYLGFDNDTAGRKFAAYTKSRLSPRILTEFVQYPAGAKDPNDLTTSAWQELKNKYNLPLISKDSIV